MEKGAFICYNIFKQTFTDTPKGVFMKKTRKIKLTALLCLALAAIICLSSCGAAGTSTPKANDSSGEFGSGLKWEFTSSDYTLTVSGSGAMPDFAESSELPWAAVKASIKAIKIKDGITHIGNKSFYGLKALTDISLPASLTSIGDLAFAFCSSLPTVSLPDTVTSLGESAFEWCSALTNVNLGGGISTLPDRAFAYCQNLDSVFALNEGFNTTAASFEGAEKLSTLTLHPSNTAYTEGALDVTVKRSDSAEEIFTVTVKYVFEDGTKAADDKLESGASGATYAVNSPVIGGYTADKLTVNGSITKDETVTVTYKKNVVQDEPAEDKDSPIDDAPTEPKKTNWFAVVIMILVVAGIGVGAFFLVRAEKKEAAKQQNQNKAKNRKQK